MRRILRFLKLITYPQLRDSWGRTLLVIGGIATGVSLIVAINIVNSSVLANFKRTIELIAGPAQLEVTLGIGEVGFDEKVVETVRADPDVASAVPLVRGTITLADDPSETLQLFGADLTAEEDLKRYHVTTEDRERILRRVEDPRSILLTEAFATHRRLNVGDAVRIAGPEGIVELTVRGLLDAQGLAAAFGRQLAVMDLPAAQQLLGKTGRVDQIDILVREGRDVRAVGDRLASALPRTLTVARPEQRGLQYERIVAAFQAMLTGISALSLLAGIYIIYNTTSTGVVRRAVAFAQLRLVGAGASFLFRLLMVEAFLLGTIGSLLGVAYGIGLAWLLTGVVSDSMGVIFQLRFPIESLAIDPRHQSLIIALGVGAALIASYAAARRVSRVDPVEIMRRTPLRWEVGKPPARFVWWWLLMLALSCGALAIEVWRKSYAWGNIGSTLWNASVLVIAVPFVGWSAAALSRILPRLFGTEGRFAAASLFRAQTRTGVTVAAVAMVMGIGVTLASLSISFRHSVTSYYREGGILPGDLVVSAVATEGGWLESPIPERVADELGRIPGVRALAAWRALHGEPYQGERVALFAMDAAFFDPSRYNAHWYRAGDPVRASEELRAGRGVNVSTALADRFDLRVGQTIELDAPTGTVSLPIVGVVRDYISDRGAVILSRRLFAERWQDSAVSRVHLFLEPGSSVDAVRASIAERLGRRYLLKIVALPEVIAYLEGKVDEAFAFTNAIQLLVVIVTVAGIFDLLLAGILERRRELALWRVVGASKRTVRRSIALESATIGGLGALLGIPVALVTAWIWVAINYRYLLGYHLEYHFAWGATGWYSVLVLVMTFVAGYAASLQATRQPVVDDLRAE